MMDDILSIWDEILLTIKEEHEITDASFSAFLKPLKPYAIDGDDLIIIFQDEAYEMGLGYIKKRYSIPLKVTIAEKTGIEYNIVFILPKDTVKYSEIKNEDSQKTSTNNDFENTENYKNSNLNTKFTFENFVMGPNNRFAYNASLAVAESPGEAYNPLYIYGGPGLGKTHLVHSIGNYIISRNSEKKVLYVTSETFINEVIESIRASNNNADTMPKLREKYRSVDILIVDDIQAIIGKESTQNEFFNTFNALHITGKQIIITSDRPPKEMDTLEERIKSRFEMGLMTDVGVPDYETRMAILRKKIEDENVTIDDSILDYIANNIKSNVRELEGALNKIVALKVLGKEQGKPPVEVTLEMAINELSTFIYPGKEREITPQHIIEIVADHYKISLDQMCSNKRTREISEPRQIAMFLCKEMTEYPFKAIGHLLGGKDHSTVIHGVNKIEDRYKDDDVFHQEIDDIKKKISNN